MIKYLSLLLLAAGGAHAITPAEAEVMRFQAAWDQPSWMHKASNLRCQLMHTIPGYGTLSFKKDAGYDQTAELKLTGTRGIGAQRGQVAFRPPNWQSFLQARPGWSFQFDDTGLPESFSPRQSQQLLDHLARGLEPTFIHRDRNNRRVMIEARTSSVMFREAHQAYLACLDSIIPVNFDQVKRTNVYFNTGSTRIDEAATQWLSYIVVYAKDPAFRRLELAGYTDSVGSFRANHKLASARVEAVRQYFLKAGFTDKQIRVRVYGEQRSIASNRTATGRKLNRRVEIKVYR